MGRNAQPARRISAIDLRREFLTIFNLMGQFSLESRHHLQRSLVARISMPTSAAIMRPYLRDSAEGRA